MNCFLDPRPSYLETKWPLWSRKQGVSVNRESLLTGVLPGREHPYDLRPRSRASAETEEPRKEQILDLQDQKLFFFFFFQKLFLISLLRMSQSWWWPHLQKPPDYVTVGGLGQPWEEQGELNWSGAGCSGKAILLESLWGWGLGVRDN